MQCFLTFQALPQILLGTGFPHGLHSADQVFKSHDSLSHQFEGVLQVMVLDFVKQNVLMAAVVLDVTVAVAVAAFGMLPSP